MIRAFMLAALALACVCSPAMALGMEPGLIGLPGDSLMRFAGLSFAMLIATVGVLGLRMELRESRPLRWTLGAVAVLALTLVAATGALAETVTVNGQPVVVLLWVDQVAAFAVALREPILTPRL